MAEIARLDQQLGASNSIFFRYSYQFTDQIQARRFRAWPTVVHRVPGTGSNRSSKRRLGMDAHDLCTPEDRERSAVGYSRIYDKRFQYDTNVMGIPRTVRNSGCSADSGERRIAAVLVQSALESRRGHDDTQR